MASAVSIAGLAPIPALKRSPATRTKASAAKVPAASRPLPREQQHRCQAREDEPNDE